MTLKEQLDQGQVKMLVEARKHVTAGAAVAFLRRLTWDPRTEDHDVVLARYKSVQAEAERAGCLDELIFAEQQVWVGMVERGKSK